MVREEMSVDGVVAVQFEMPMLSLSASVQKMESSSFVHVSQSLIMKTSNGFEALTRASAGRRWSAAAAATTKSLASIFGCLCVAV
jgi:hypothetical protein